MHASPSIRLMFGPSRLPHTSPMLTVALTPAELHRLAALIDRDAYATERDGDLPAADSLHWRAAALREAMR